MSPLLCGMSGRRGHIGVARTCWSIACAAVFAWDAALRQCFLSLAGNGMVWQLPGQALWSAYPCPLEVVMHTRHLVDPELVSALDLFPDLVLNDETLAQVRAE